MSLQARELRIGNWVLAISRWNDGNKHWTYEQITDLSDSLEAFNHTANGIDGNCNNEIKPILLTEDILLKCEFKQLAQRHMWVKGKVCVVFMDYPDLRGKSTGEKFYVGFKDMGNVIYHTQFEIPYLHSLQNAYALTGEELTVNL